MNLKKTEKLKQNKKFIDCTIFFLSTKSPHFSLSGKVGQLCERKRVLCWSIHIIS